MPRIYSPVVLTEGAGDQEAVPFLLRHLIAAAGVHDIFPASRPIRVGDIPKLRRDGELERFIRYGSSRDDGDGVIMLLDCDDGCPCTVAGEFTRRIRAIQPAIGKPVGIGFLKKEYECLFLASIASIAAAYPEYGWSLDSFDAEQDMEEIRGAKSQLSKLMRPGRSYKPTRDQVKFTSRCDCARLRARSRSFRHCESLIDWMAGRRFPDSMIYPIV